MIHLTAVEKRASFPQEARFPYNVPVIARLESVRFETAVTFLVGENGSGKSTFLEALATAVRLPTVGAEEAGRDPSLMEVRQLSKHLRLGWTKRTGRGFYLRAEDFFGFAKRISQMQAELQADMAGVDAEYAGRSEFAKGLAKMPYAGQLAAIRESYGDGLDDRSHGEAFLALFQARFVPNGLYLLDEPEAPLSPLRQVGMLALLQEMVARDAQFIIATHSPILMAFPGATLLNFDQSPPQPVPWDTLEHVSVTREFLNNPQLYLNHLSEEWRVESERHPLH